MTTQTPNNPLPQPAEQAEKQDKNDKKKRFLLLFMLLTLLAMLCCAGGLFGRYLYNPEPLPDMLPLPVQVNYAPHYQYSIYGVDHPVGVTISPDYTKVYAAETGGERMVKIFATDGTLLDAFAPPRTGPGHRSPVYLATDNTGRVFVTDRLQHAVFVYDANGNYQDSILSPDMTLSEYIAKHVDGITAESSFAYNIFEQEAYYWQTEPVTDQETNLDELEASYTFPAPDRESWAPLGVRFDSAGNMLLTDVATKDFSAVRALPANVMQAASWQEFNPPESQFGAYGQDNGQFLFPNTAVTDSQGRVYVTDGNNGRISVWDGRGNFLFNFGQGSGDGALSLPRGAAIDEHDRLHVVDAVGQDIKVYDVSADEPEFLFAFGDWGSDDGQFDYPGDIALDANGRLYITDRENNRIQVWSY